jgi:CheY-like chemotaxis protein
MRILILEDNEDRRSAMSQSLKNRFPQHAVEFFIEVEAMERRLREAGLGDVLLVSLDHDLELLENNDGTTRDPGTGVDAAKQLATLPATCPVIVHTTNTIGGDQMVETLSRTGWKVHRVTPYGGEDWIGEVWAPLVRRLLR